MEILWRFCEDSEEKLVVVLQSKLSPASEHGTENGSEYDATDLNPYVRKDHSLASLCKRFFESYASQTGTVVHLELAAEKLGEWVVVGEAGWGWVVTVTQASLMVSWKGLKTRCHVSERQGLCEGAGTARG